MITLSKQQAAQLRNNQELINNPDLKYIKITISDTPLFSDDALYVLIKIFKRKKFMVSIVDLIADCVTDTVGDFQFTLEQYQKAKKELQVMGIIIRQYQECKNDFQNEITRKTLPCDFYYISPEHMESSYPIKKLINLNYTLHQQAQKINTDTVAGIYINKSTQTFFFVEKQKLNWTVDLTYLGLKK